MLAHELSHVTQRHIARGIERFHGSVEELSRKNARRSLVALRPLKAGQVLELMGYPWAQKDALVKASARYARQIVLQARKDYHLEQFDLSGQ